MKKQFTAKLTEVEKQRRMGICSNARLSRILWDTRPLLVPANALLRTRAMATLKNDDATYGRSLMYCSRAPPSLAGPRRVRTSPTGSTSSSSAAVQRSEVASGRKQHI
jgi:hypothetical protein